MRCLRRLLSWPPTLEPPDFFPCCGSADSRGRRSSVLVGPLCAAALSALTLAREAAAWVACLIAVVDFASFADFEALDLEALSTAASAAAALAGATSPLGCVVVLPFCPSRTRSKSAAVRRPCLGTG